LSRFDRDARTKETRVRERVGRQRKSGAPPSLRLLTSALPSNSGKVLGKHYASKYRGALNRYRFSGIEDPTAAMEAAIGIHCSERFFRA
jgi:hypothetical protein